MNDEMTVPVLISLLCIALVVVAVSALTLDFLRWIRRSRPGSPPRP